MFKIVILFLTTAFLTLQATPLLKTGQTQNYDADGNIVTDGSVKDDGYYQIGATRSYSRSGNVVTDNATGLEWQDNESVEKKWKNNDNPSDTASTYCSNLSLNGVGWRLPTIGELETLVDYSKYNPAVTEDVFQHIYSDDYWSSTDDDWSFGAWYVSFYAGTLESMGEYEYSRYVRCVRGGE